MLVRTLPVLLIVLTLAPIARAAGSGPDGATRWIAHAGGAIDSRPMTNSLEALEASYTRGYRWFEVDFSWAADGRLVLIHDWGRIWRTYHGGGPRPTTAQFTTAPFVDGLTPLTVDGVLDWLAMHPDAHLVTDIKHRSLAGLRQIHDGCDDRGVCDRVVPQIYGMDQHHTVASMGFEHIVLTLYRRLQLHPGGAIARYAERRRPLAITMPDWLFSARRLGPLLQQRGTPVWIHTVNDPAALQGLCPGPLPDGVYTDDLLLEPICVPP